jgi:hypothetical protein
LKCLDLIITADTAIAHLAGALAVPFWIALSALPHWPWLLEREDSPWYPSARLFRQEKLGAWESVFAQMAAELHRQARPAKPGALWVELSAGELLDRIAILQIKSERFTDAAKREHVRAELAALEPLRAAMTESVELRLLKAELRSVNEALWEIEDALRICERDQDFGARFVHWARSVYQQNDRRTQLKQQINVLLGSALVEEKEHPSYGH